MATQQLVIFEGPPLRLTVAYEDSTGEIGAFTGSNSSASVRYTVTVTPTGKQARSIAFEPGTLNGDGSVTQTVRTETIPKGQAKYATVADGTLVFDGSIAYTGVRV